MEYDIPLSPEQQAELEKRQADGPDPNIPPPAPTEAMFYGLAGQVGKTAATHTEVNPVAATAAFLSYLSAQIGRDAYLSVGNTFHHASLFTCHIGRSGRGRKGDAVSLTHRIRSRVEEVHSLVPGQYHGGGLSTREGLALLIHDGYTQGKTEVPAIDDKRLWIVENEFANVLHQGKRDGNTLSAALRDAWDGMSIKPAIKSARIWATDPHIALHVAVTPGELRELMTTRELSNGFANRFLMLWAERSCIEPFPQPASKETVNELANQTAVVIQFAKGKYPSAKDTRPMSLSDAASELWAVTYRRLIKEEATDTLTGLMERSAPYALRLAMLFALTDKRLTIEVHHLEAALAWIQYSRRSIRFVFTSTIELEKSEVDRENAGKILQFLKDKPEGATRKQINDECFLRHESAAKIDAAIKLLLAESPPKITAERSPRADGRPGRGAYRYKIFSCSYGEHSEHSELRRTARPRATFDDCELSEHSFSEQATDDLSSQSSQTAKTSETRTTSQSSQHSQSSHKEQRKSEATDDRRFY